MSIPLVDITSQLALGTKCSSGNLTKNPHEIKSCDENDYSYYTFRFTGAHEIDLTVDASRNAHRAMDSVFGLADDVYGGLASVRPKLSQHQLEQVNAILVHSLYKAGSLSGIAPAVNDSFLRNACTELWARIAQDSGVRAPWVGLVVRILSGLCLKAGLDRVLFLVHIWRIIAQPSEELCSGMGRAIMQTSLESTFGKDFTQAGESLGPLAGGDLKLLMDWVFYALQKDGHVPSPSTSEVNLSIRARVARELEILIVEEADTTILPSQSGMLLAIDLGSQILFMLENLDATHCGPDFLEILEAWRWSIHQEVVRLLRGCRSEAVRKHVIVTIAGPLYHGWKHSDALEDLWHLIASPGEGQSVELQLALLCILAEDFMCVLNVPTRHAQGFWNLIHLAISNKSSSLSRRRGLHVLQKLLALADDEGIEDDQDDEDDENNSNNPKASTCPKTESYCPQAQAQPRRIAGWTKDGRCCLKDLFCRDALVQWKDYARVMEVLEMETEMHLLDQVIPTVERLCAKLSVNTCCARAHPMVTEFRWLAIPLGLLITTGTIARRRALMSRIITGDLGLGRPCNNNNNNTGNGNGNDRDNAGSEDHEDHNRCCALSKVDETWVAQVLVPALDQVGWHSSTSKTSLNVFSRSVRDFLRCFVKTLSVPRMKIFLQLLFKAIRERFIGSTGALFTLLAALDLNGAKIPAMGPKELFQLKDMLMAILPPLNQAKRTLLLDGIVQILEAFTDYKNPAISLSLSVTDLEAHGLREVSSPPALNVIMDIISAIPGDLITRRYLPQLVSWVSSFPFRPCGTSVAQGFEENELWLVLFKGRMEAYLMGGRRSDRRQTGGIGGRQVKTSAEGQHLCLLGLVLSEGFASKDKHGEVLTMGLSPLVKVLRKCWNEPYVAEEMVQAALTLFSAWIKASGGVRDNEKQRWRRRPLEASVHEVTTYVSVRLTSMIDATDEGKVPHVDGGDAQIVLNALEAAMTGVPGISQNAVSRLTLSAGLHPDVLSLRETCVSLLIKCGQCRVAPAAHMLAVASLEIIVRSIIDNGVGPEGGGDSYGYGYRHRMERERLGIDGFSGISGIGGTLLSCLVLVTPAQGVDVVRSLLHHNVDGRVTSPDGEGLVGQGWADISKQHEQRRWSCLSVLLVAVLGQVRTSDVIERELPLLQEEPEVFNALVEGIRSCSREEMPMAISCFRTSFPWYMQSLYQNQRSSAFMRVFELVWSTIMEARRPQFTLVLDFVSAVLHPVHLAMPELCSSAPTSASQEASLTAESCIVSAFKSIVEFGVSNKPNVMRAVAGRLIELWRQCPGGFFQLVPEMSELLLFKEWGQGIENVSNASNRANSATEAPRLMLLLFLEKTVIPSAAKGHQQQQESKQMLRALTMVIMDKHNSKEFRQAGITDQVTYGRKLRSWQALCILCGFLCGVSPSPSSSTSITISSSKCTASASASASAIDDGHTSELIEAVAAWFWPVHGRTSLPAVRQLMEVFAVRMCQAHPDVFVPAAIEQLSDVRLPGQVLCSLLIISGHVLVGKRKEALSSPKHRLNLFKACLPWMVGTHVMGRMIAQLICHSLLPEVLGDIEGTGTPLENIFSFLDDNADMVVMRERQLEAFRKTDCAAMCTVEGMLEAHGSGTNGEIIPIHMCELLQKMMDDIWNEGQQDKIRALEEGRFWLQTSAKVEKGTWFDEDEALSSGFDDFIHIQQKIIPWDKLDLAVDVARSTSLEQSTAAGRMRQPVVMCATLVDKVPNLAGLARTCEIFAASNLLVPDLGALKNPSFSKISTGAEQWLPVEELREEQLLSWLTRLKKQGYTVVGIEQTNNSVCLTKVKFPRRCVLVLGREHSGLPLRVINEMNICCQIPQQGVLRSLNAHVSGSLVLWEYTRQMLQIVS